MSVMTDTPPQPEVVPDFTLVRDDPPFAHTAELADNMAYVAENHPNEWMRIATFEGEKSSRMASDYAAALRNGRRARKRPAGHWSFKSGRVEGSEDEAGVWARVRPLTQKEQKALKQ